MIPTIKLSVLAQASSPADDERLSPIPSYPGEFPRPTAFAGHTHLVPRRLDVIDQQILDLGSPHSPQIILRQPPSQAPPTHLRC